MFTWLKNLWCGFFAPMLELSEWYFVQFDEQNVYVNANPPNKESWAYQFEWQSIQRVCFEDGGLRQSDCLYIWVQNQERAYMIPTEASGGSELFGELNKRGFFPDDLMKQAASSTDGGLYCYPALDD